MKINSINKAPDCDCEFVFKISFRQCFRILAGLEIRSFALLLKIAQKLLILKSNSLSSLFNMSDREQIPLVTLYKRATVSKSLSISSTSVIRSWLEWFAQNKRFPTLDFRCLPLRPYNMFFMRLFHLLSISFLVHITFVPTLKFHFSPVPVAPPTSYVPVLQIHPSPLPAVNPGPVPADPSQLCPCS